MNYNPELGDAMGRVDDIEEMEKALEQTVAATIGEARKPVPGLDEPESRYDMMKDQITEYRKLELELIENDLETIKKLKANCEARCDELTRSIAARRKAVAACEKFLEETKSAGELKKPRAQRKPKQKPTPQQQKPTLVKKAA